MSEKGRIRKMFPGGNTTVGPKFLFQYIIRPDATRIFIIKGGPGVGKSTLMNAISREMVDKGYDVEHIHCASDPDSLDALVIPEIGVALMDGTAPHITDPKYPGAVDEIINLGEFWDESKITPFKKEIMEINKKGNMHFETAFSLLKQSRMAYDQWKWYVEESINKAEYNRISRQLVENILEGAVPNNHAAPQSRHLFASAITPKGVLDYKDTLIDNDMKVISIKGMPGTGVKELIERIAQEAEEYGLYTEQFHCPFEPEKLDMLIIPTFRTVVMNSSQPYHFDPGKLEGLNQIDEVDLDICIHKDSLNEYEEERADAEKRCHELLEKGIEYLAKAKAAHGAKEKYYFQAMDYNKVEKKRNEILKRILSYA
ncbi:MAG TPA: hypothetical protein GX505_10325 [Clostridiales bacterium]|nr:hypothetical protein [Clostridiales bacterium]